MTIQQIGKVMRSKVFITISIGVLVVLATLVGIQLLSHRKDSSSSAIAASSLPPHATSAVRQIKIAEARIDKLPSEVDGYSLLAAAYMQKARETGDFEFNAQAESALKRALELDSNNRSTLTMRASLLLTYHRFREALEEAKRLQASGPESPELYGIMTDALVELGDYPEAVKAAQKMMNLRPDAAAYARASYLRALHGDLDRAIEAMQVAVKAANGTNPENASWYRVHLGVELMSAGKRDEAEREFDLALNTFPRHHLALAAKGRARIWAGDFEAGVEFYRQAQERVPLPDYAIALGDLYTRLGRADEAKRQYELAQFIETTNAGQTYSRQLALFWADHDIKLDEALEIMKRERTARNDIFTHDALAWCLFKKGQFAEARASIQQAMKLGTHEPRLFYHAGMIYGALGERGRAANYLKLALATDGSLDVLQTEVAKRKLDELRSISNFPKSAKAPRG